MYFFIADEAVHQQTDPTKFFIFGGIIVPVSVIPLLTKAVEDIRERYNFLPDDSFKFSPNDRPKQVTRENFIKAKTQVLDLAIQNRVNFVGYSMLHAIGRQQTSDTIIRWGADALLTKFQQYLQENDDARGMAFFDTLPISRPNSYLRRAFQFRNEHEKSGHRLGNIDMVATTTDGCSHLTSICDICVGSFRYSVNEPNRDKAGKVMMRKLKLLFWVRQGDGKIYPFDRGILLRPERVTHPAYKADYDELKTRLLTWMNSEPVS